jgi:hypothetical protein
VVFAFNVRPERAPKWRRQVVYGRRVRDVLVTNRGAALVRTEFHAVDGSRLEVAVSASDVGHVDALARARSGSDERKGTV